MDRSSSFLISFLVFFVLDQVETVVNAVGQFFLVMGNHDHGLVLPFAESLDNVLDQSPVCIVKSMEGFVQDP